MSTETLSKQTYTCQDCGWEFIDVHVQLVQYMESRENVHHTFSPSQRGCKHLVHLLDSLSHCLFLHFDWSCLPHTMHEEYEDCVCNNWSEANGNE